MSCGVKNPQEAIEVYTKAKDIMLQVGFNLRKWNSNDPTVLNAINDTEKKGNVSTTAQVKQTIAEDDQTYSQYAIRVPNNNDRSKTKILGVNWDSETDK